MSAVAPVAEFSFGIATHEDANAISDLVCNAFYEKDTFRVRTAVGRQRTTPAEVLKEMQARNHTWYILKNPNPKVPKIVAAVLYVSDNQKDCSLHMLSRDPSLDKTLKLGARILKETIEVAKKEGKERMLIEVCDVNTQLISYYKAEHGFQTTEQPPKPFCEDCPQVLVPEMRGKINLIQMAKSILETSKATKIPPSSKK